MCITPLFVFYALPPPFSLHPLLSHVPTPFSSQRIEIFHGQVREDRRSLGIADPHDHNARSPSTYITVQRGRILEDGFVQLSATSVEALKGNVKVKFMNEQVRVTHPFIFVNSAAYSFLF